MLKNKIDTLKVGRHFKRENSEDLEKFLEWMFKNDEERENFRNFLNADQ